MVLQLCVEHIFISSNDEITPLVSFDSWGHPVPQVFKSHMDEQGLDIRSSVTVMRAHLKMSES